MESYLTFLKMQHIKDKVRTWKLKELQNVNQTIREKDRIKKMLLRNLSDKLILLSER